LICFFFKGWKYEHHKNPIKERWPEPSQGRQKGRARERPKDEQLAGTTKGKELVPLMVGSSHPRPL
jgi:hypothetical protein